VVTSSNQIAVAMATFNGARFLEAQLRSIFDQTRRPDEIVISDDHSTDDTLKIARSFRAEAKKLGIAYSVVTHSGKPGVARNFSNAVSKTRAGLVALADQDDWWEPGKLESLERIFTGDTSLLMVHSDAELVDEGGAPLGMGLLESLRITGGEQHSLMTGHGIKALVRRNLVTGATSMIRRELAEVSGSIPEGWLHDEWWALIAASRDGLLLDPTRYQHYRQHDSNQVGATQSGLARLMERFGEPQELFRERHRVRHEGLRSFLSGPEFSGTPEAKKLLLGRLNHYRWQSTLPASRLARIPAVVGAALRGEYAKYRRGLFDALRDLLQPA
jgi:glycosyltransferase involved in cell wall biosynthesis